MGSGVAKSLAGHRPVVTVGQYHRTVVGHDPGTTPTTGGGCSSLRPPPGLYGIKSGSPRESAEKKSAPSRRDDDSVHLPPESGASPDPPGPLHHRKRTLDPLAR